ncbi:WD40 repeat domain-containing protein [Gordonia phosphorivorans]|uniref:WD40 repeat domain-containing protein n=1 Tax=Gordonia phosphorivorans TaxID=1056982 RepID=A0ABV6HC98_9ACTN
MTEELKVVVIGAAADQLALREISDVLTQREVRIMSPGAAENPDAVVVGVSSALVRDSALMSDVAGWQSAKLVPVRIGPVVDVEVPQFLSELNWILWESTVDSGERNATLLTALRMDLHRYRDSQSLEAQAAAWVYSGREPDYLMSDRRAIKRSLETTGTVGAADDVGTASPRLIEYLEYSRQAARKEWWRRNRRWAFRFGVLAAIVAIAVTGFRAISDLKSSNILAAGLLGVSSDEGRPDLQGLKMAGLMIQQSAAGREVPQAAYGKLIAAMEAPWGRGVLGYAKDAHLNGFALTGDPDIALSADSVGTVVTWDLRTGGMTSRTRISQQPLFGIVSTPDGAIIATYDQDSVVRVTNLVSGDSSEIQLPSLPLGIAVSSDGAAAAVFTEGGDLSRVRVGAAGQLKAESVGEFTEVHDLRAGPAGQMWAAVRDGGDLAVVDVLSGRVVERYGWPQDPAEVAAVSPSGKTVVAADGRGELLRNAGSTLRPVGMRVSLALTAMAVDDAGQVVVMSSIGGARLVDTAAKRVSRVCAVMDSVRTFSLSPDGRTLVCGNMGVGEIADLTTSMSVPEPSSRLVGADGSDVEAAGTSVAIDDDGSVRISGRGWTTVLNPDAVRVETESQPDVPWVSGRIFGEGTPSNVAITPDGTTVAVATSAGAVTEIDVAANGAIGLAARHNFGPREVSRVRWSPDRRQLWAMTSDGRWLMSQSCAGCGNSLDALFKGVRERVWFCYPTATLDFFPDRTQRELGLTECPQPLGVPA